MRNTLVLAAGALMLPPFLAAAWLWAAPPPKAISVAEPAKSRVSYPRGHYPLLVLPNGDRRNVRSVLRVDRPMHFGDYIWNDLSVSRGPVWVRIDLGKQMISVFRDGNEIGTAVILFGTDGTPTPTGVFPIIEKAPAHRSNRYDAEMPFMLRLTKDGVAIHASAVRAGSATHGCVGVPMGFARALFAEVKLGDPVAIIASS